MVRMGRQYEESVATCANIDISLPILVHGAKHEVMLVLCLHHQRVRLYLALMTYEHAMQAQDQHIAIPFGKSHWRSYFRLKSSGTIS